MQPQANVFMHFPWTHKEHSFTFPRSGGCFYAQKAACGLKVLPLEALNVALHYLDLECMSP